MNRTLITSMASGWYKKLIPLFEYTAKKYNPDCDVKVFDKDEAFPNYPDNATSALRFLMLDNYFENYDYVYITDVDFIFLHHEPPMMEYHINNIKQTGLPYSAYRGKIKRGKTVIWDGKFTRMAAGIVVITKEWLNRTKEIREKVREKVKNGLDRRVRDEIILFRMFRAAGIKTPKQRRCLYNGKLFDKNYRNLHLGDFRSVFAKKRWKRMERMQNWFFSDKSVEAYRDLQKDAKFNNLVQEARKEPRIDEMFRNLSWHLSKRK